MKVTGMNRTTEQRNLLRIYSIDKKGERHGKYMTLQNWLEIHHFSDYTNLKKKQDLKERSLQSWKCSIRQAV